MKCAFCGKEFEPHKNTRLNWQKYCSQKCRERAYWLSRKAGKKAPRPNKK